MSLPDRSAKEQETTAEKAGDEAAQPVEDEAGVGKEPPSDPEQLREEIVETRRELGDTVEALAHKADVKARAQEKVAERKEQVRETQERAKAKAGEAVEQARRRPAPLIVFSALAVALVIFLLIRRR
jgi:cobalamin biosynthesis Mg chelatase CobN